MISATVFKTSSLKPETLKGGVTLWTPAPLHVVHWICRENFFVSTFLHSERRIRKYWALTGNSSDLLEWDCTSYFNKLNVAPTVNGCVQVSALLTWTGIIWYRDCVTQTDSSTDLQTSLSQCSSMVKVFLGWWHHVTDPRTAVPLFGHYENWLVWAACPRASTHRCGVVHWKQ